MERIIERLLACGVSLERAKMLLNYYGTDGKWEDLENYVVVLEMHKGGKD